MKHIILIIAFFYAEQLCGQDQIKIKLDSLQLELNRLKDDKRRIEERISNVESKINELNKSLHLENGKLKVQCNGGYLMDNPNSQAVILVQIPKNSDVFVEVTFLKNDYLKASFGNFEGFIYKNVLVQTKDLKTLLKNLEAFSVKEKQNELKESYEKRKSDLTKIHGSLIAQQILNNEYWIGMTTLQARESLGSPQTINESVGSWGRNEQWVYDNLYLYFENSKLSSYQIRK